MEYSTIQNRNSKPALLNIFIKGFVTTTTLFAIASGVEFSLNSYASFATKEIPGFVGFIVASLVFVVSRAGFDIKESLLVKNTLKGYIGKRRLQKLLSGEEPLSLTGSKKELSTLLLDIVSFTKITKKLSPEAGFHFMQKFYALVDPIIYRYGGNIDKKTGDGFFAVFGDDQELTAEQAAKNAVKAAVDIQALLSRLDPRALGLSQELKVRIGVNSGELMIGNTGSQEHFNYTVLGETANFTQRLEAACPPGKVLMGEKTATYVLSSFKLRETQISVKNEEDTHKAFVVS